MTSIARTLCNRKYKTRRPRSKLSNNYAVRVARELVILIKINARGAHSLNVSNSVDGNATSGDAN